jgi:PAS domain S-box-containing protein
MPPGLILLDISLPDMTGYEICTALKSDAKTQDIPIIFISALNEALDKVKAFAAGGVDYISKPFEIAEVLARIENQLALQAAKHKIQQLNEVLELRVAARTAQIELTNQQLRFSNQQLKVVNNSLEQEMSERQQAQSQLRLFHSVVVNAKDAVLITTAKLTDHADINPAIVYANDAFTSMTGYTLNEVIGKTPSFLHGQNTDLIARSQIRAALKAWQPIQTEILNYRKDGTAFWVELNITPVADETGEYTHWVSVQRDITQRKHQEQETLKALAQEKELSELKSRFVSTASHEFRTPLATILSSVDLLEHYGHLSTDCEKQQYYQQIRTAIQRMTALMSDVLTLDRSGTGRMELNPKPLNLDGFCRDLVAEIQLSNSEGHEIDLSLNGPCARAVMDEKILRHVFINLLSNAVKYSPQGGKISFEVSCAERNVVFKVQDQGIGIPPESCLRLFEPFYRAKNVGNIPGTGLGLSIVRQLIELHQGQVDVESQVGVGTIFTVTLPLQPPPP